MQRRVHDLGDLLRRDRRLPTPARAHTRERLQALDREPLPPRRPPSPATHLPEQRSACSPYPRPASSNTLARCTSRCAAVLEPASRSSTSRCSSLIASGGVGETHTSPYHKHHLFTRHYTCGVSQRLYEIRGRFGASGGRLERSLQAGEVSGAEDEAVARRDVQEVEIDAGLRDLSSQVGEDARPILDLDDDHFAFAADDELRERQRVPGSFGVRDENVQLDLICRSQAGRRREVDAGVADRGRNARQAPGLVLDLYDQVERNRRAPRPSSVGCTLSERLRRGVTDRAVDRSAQPAGCGKRTCMWFSWFGYGTTTPPGPWSPVA